MFNPLTLRICCLAIMAPALTSEAATRARETLQGAPTSPGIPLLSGRIHSQISMSNTSKGGKDVAPHPKPTTANLTAQVVTISKDLQKKLTESGHLVDEGKTSQQMRGRPVVNLGSLANLSDLYKQQHLEVFGTTSIAQGNKSTTSSIPNSGHSLPTGIGTVHTTSNGTVTMTGSTNLHSALLISKPSVSSGCTTSSVYHTVSTSSVSSPTIKNAPNHNVQKMSIKPAVPSTSKTLVPSTCTKPVVPSTSLKPVVPSTSLKPVVPSTSSKPALPSTSQLPSGSSQVSTGMTNGFSVVSRQPPKPSTIPQTSRTLTNPEAPLSNNRSSDSNKSKAPVQATPQMIDSVTRRQKMLETRTERLLRRLRRLQSRQAISHSKQQLSQFVEQQRHAMPSYGKNTNVDFQTELLHSKSMSTAALVELVHKMQSTQSTLRQQLAAYQEPDETTKLGEDRCADLDRVSGHLKCNMSHLQTMVDSDATESSSGGESCDEFDYDDDWDGKVPRTPISCRSEWHWSSERAAVAARWTWLQAQVSDLEYRIRQQYDIYKQIRANKGNVVLGEPPPPIDLMAKSKAGRKLSPLEEKIANLQAKTEVSPANISNLLSNVDKQSNQLANQMGPLYTPHQSPGSSASSTSNSTVATPKTPSVLNGYVDGVSRTSDNVCKVTNGGLDQSLQAVDHTFQAARCRPVKSYRKRKLLRTSGLHHLNRKAARLSTVQCHCYPPVSPCAMCGGRYNNTTPMDATTMPYMERVALVDISYHPVLSFQQDIGLSTQCESMLKTGEWQQKPAPRTYRMVQPDRKRLKVKDGNVRKYQRRLKKNTSATILSSTKIRNKYEQKQLTRNLVNSPVKTSVVGSDKKLSRAELRLRKRKVRDSIRHLNKKGANSRRHDSLSTSQSQMWRELKDGLRKKRGENAYDIDNIVIPYSIAASTRVEKLQYKEIITPKWREVDAKSSVAQIETAPVPEPAPQPVAPVIHMPPEITPVLSDIPLVSDTDRELLENEDSEIEDLCDDIFKQRHLRCEILEKKRFATALSTSTNSQRRSRGAQRADSTASAASTSNVDMYPVDMVQPESFHTVTPPDTPVAPSPLPIPVIEELDELTRKSLQDATRRRSSSVSSSKSTHSRCASHSEDRSHDDDKPIVPPWVKRTFPLSKNEFDTLAQGPTLPSKPGLTLMGLGTVKVITQEMVIRQCAPSSPIPGDNSDTSSEIVEDPDDPEWTVISERQQQTKQAHLVLKLAKR